MILSRFYGKDKSAWSAWDSYPQLTDAICSETDEDTLVTLECYIVIVHDKTSDCDNLNAAHK